MCGKKDETVNHLICECSKMAQTGYHHRLNNVARIIHWKLSKNHGMDATEKWYEHMYYPENVSENGDAKLL